MEENTMERIDDMAERVRAESLCPTLPGHGEVPSDPVVAEILEVLSAMGISWSYVTHPPVRSIEDCAAPAAALGALMPKNYFLTTRSRSVFWLLVTRPEARFRTASVSKQLGVSRLSFAAEADLFACLQTAPGAVTPLGLLWDEAHRVRLAVDERLREEPVLAFHPCTDRVSVAIPGSAFFGSFLPALGVEPVFVRIGEEEEVNE